MDDQGCYIQVNLGAADRRCIKRNPALACPLERCASDLSDFRTNGKNTRQREIATTSWSSRQHSANPASNPSHRTYSRLHRNLEDTGLRLCSWEGSRLTSAKMRKTLTPALIWPKSAIRERLVSIRRPMPRSRPSDNKLEESSDDVAVRHLGGCISVETAGTVRSSRRDVC